MQRSTQLNKAVLELKLMCDQGVLVINLACPFVPHSGHMHLPDQKRMCTKCVCKRCLKEAV